MKTATKTAILLALLVGLILFAGLVASQGFGTIYSTLGAGDWALLWLGPIYVVPLSLAALEDGDAVGGLDFL